MTDVRERARHGYQAFFSRKGTRHGPTPKDYERAALKEVDRFKNAEPSRLGSALDRIRKPMARAADAALDNAVGQAISKGVEGMMNTLNERAAWSVRTDVIYAQFRSDGHADVHNAGDIHRLELSDVDRTVRGLARKYESVAFVEGAGTGVLGLAGTAIDVPSLVSIALRAVAEYAAHYGFDPSIEDEKAFILMLLSVVSAPTVDERRQAIAEITDLSLVIAGGDSRAESRRLLSMQMVTNVANTLASRLVKAKAAQSIPVLGAGVAAAFNAWFLKTLTESAYQLYRERFLIQKRGPKVVVRVKP